MKEIKQRHDNGTQELDDPDRAPTGSAYHRHSHHHSRPQPQLRQPQNNSSMMTTAGNQNYNDMLGQNIPNNNKDASLSDSDSDDDDDHWLNNDNDDDELEAIRQRRLNQLREMQAKTAQQRALGHGEVRTITQDEFLPECTGSSEWVAVHFFHSEFERCKIMDHHLKLIASRYLSCKFLRLDAEKAPFFVQKLKIKTLPTLIVFREGKAVDRLMGFEGLAADPKEPDKWQTKRLEWWISKTGAIEYKVGEGDEDEVVGKRTNNVAFHYSKGSVWSGFKGASGKSTTYEEDYYDDDDE
jgi:thiol-disulfide isomerase/thioredoxin